MSDLGVFPRLDLALSAAILVVLALRWTVARHLGGGAAYALWLLAPVSGLATCLPARVIERSGDPNMLGVLDQSETAASLIGRTGLPPAWIDIPAVLDIVWLTGVAISLASLLLRQQRFLKRIAPLSPVASDGRLYRAARSDAGPALVGFFSPKIVMPADFDIRYSAAECEVMVAHEATHLARNDVRINTVVAVAQCIFWYNPLIHIAACYLRIDQELACDEAVVARHPTARRAYAETLLKTQTTNAALPIGCHWLGRSKGPLHARISLLAQPPKGRSLRWLGVSGAILSSLAAGTVVWAANPPRYTYAIARSPKTSGAISASDLRSERAGRPEVPERPERRDMPRVLEQPKWPERPEQAERPEQSERVEQAERAEVPERPEQAEQPEAPERPEQPERPEIARPA